MLVEVALPLPLENLFSYAVPERLSERVCIGQEVIVPFRNNFLRGVVIEVHPVRNKPLQAAAATPSAEQVSNGVNDNSNSRANLKEVVSLAPAAPLPKQLLELTRWIAEHYACSWGEALSLVFSSWGRNKKELYLLRREELPQTTLGIPYPWGISYSLRDGNGQEGGFSLPLTPEQKEAVEKIKQAISCREQKTFLLFGVTSSGKTEVYIQAIQKHLSLSASAQILFLVPEISLCQPFYEIFSRRFAITIAVWHSLISQKEKKNIAEKLSLGNSMILIGARSALFAPFTNLAAIILDEEHDSSYKQQEKPRYHAREVALKLGQLHGAQVLLGSATPSIESFHRAEKKEFTLLKLSRRIPPQTQPKMLLLDQRKSLRRKEILSPELVKALEVCLSRREQAILALNRRGYSTYLLCAECGFIFRCPNCQLTLVHYQTPHLRETLPGLPASSADKPAVRSETRYSVGEGVLRCHFCFYRKTIPSRCENCKSASLFFGGAGTQKVVHELKKLFPFARVLRLDRDIGRKKKVALQTFQSFKKETADILVGTQMVSQGFDFPRVTVVGIVDADTALHQPDFRAAEKTFQWVCQSAGRSARSALGGKVFVQTSLPSHYALLAACKLDYESFYQKELEFRKSFFYPPYSNLVLFRIESSTRKDLVPREAERLAELLKKISLASPACSGVQILGPGPAPKEQLRKKIRWQILVKCSEEQKLLQVLQIGKSFQPAPGIRLILDADPYHLT